jgi:hypothetical protein
MKSVLCVFILAFSSVLVRAEGVANLYEVDFVRVDKSGLGYVKFTANLGGTPPTCGTANGYPQALSFNTNDSGGKAILSIALTAKASGKKIFAVGTNLCDHYGVMEQWNWGYIQ